MKLKKRIIRCSLFLFAVIGLFVTYLAEAKRSDSSQDDDVTIEVKRYDYSDSQDDNADNLQYEDSTEDFYEYEAVNQDIYEYEDIDVTEDFYEYEFEGDDKAEIEVKRHDYTR